MIWLALCIVAMVWLHFTPRESVQEACAATLVLSTLGLFVVEQVMQVHQL